MTSPAAGAGPAAPRAAGIPHAVTLAAAALVAVSVMGAAVVVTVSRHRTHDGSNAAATAPAAPAAPQAAAAEPDSGGEAEGPIAPTLIQLLSPSSDEPQVPTVEDVVTRSMPAVVKVETRDGFGAAFFVSKDTLLTNAHVVGSHPAVNLRLSGGQSRTARVETVWRNVDLAVLKPDIVDPDQVFLALAATSDVRIGGEVLAIGSPLGLQNTVTRGIVSGTREYVYDRIGRASVRVVQTDAAINPGNSGGPLIDRYGRVIGVNTLKLGGPAEGLGFAVEIAYARRMLGPDFSSKSAEDQRREDGLRRYDDYIRRLAQRADEVEARWKQLRSQCFKGASGIAPVREWFTLREGGAAMLHDTPSCVSWHRYFLGWANNTHDALEQYTETALLAGVPPAKLRSVRRTYNMTWAAWQE